jgi:hypothetical protein
MPSNILIIQNIVNIDQITYIPKFNSNIGYILIIVNIMMQLHMCTKLLIVPEKLNNNYDNISYYFIREIKLLAQQIH